VSLKKNIIANYASQLYVAGVGILILPLYIKYMGAEAYGLVGFFTMLQAWFGLLDMGLTPTIGRETARYHGGSMSALVYRQLFRALSLIFLAVAVVGGSSLFLLADLVARQWLNIESLDMNTVVIAVQIMAISVALRWMCGLYRGVVTGSERLVWLSGFNILIATLRFIAVFVSMWQFGFTPLVFFIHQLAVALIELTGLFWMGSRLLPSKTVLQGEIGWSFKPIKPVLKFALTIAFTSSIWVLVTQTDKLILSGILPLAEYGYFTLAVLVASGIMVMSGPISSAIMPRMARLNAEGKHDEMIKVYRNSTQLVTVICGSAAITIAFTAEKLLFAWTGDAELAQQAAPILRLYAIGNGFLALAAFPYYLQYALGNLRYHLIGNAVTVCILIPAIVFAASAYGAIGAGWVWLSLNGWIMGFWVGFIHYKLVSGLHLKWLIVDVAKILLPVFFILWIVSSLSLPSGGRIYELSIVVILGMIALTVAVYNSSYIKSFLLHRVKNG
jgi:O-antigen/teichoic acid export membrane protein